MVAVRSIAHNIAVFWLRRGRRQHEGGVGSALHGPREPTPCPPVSLRRGRPAVTPLTHPATIRFARSPRRRARARDFSRRERWLGWPRWPAAWASPTLHARRQEALAVLARLVETRGDEEALLNQIRSGPLPPRRRCR